MGGKIYLDKTVQCILESDRLGTVSCLSKI